MNRFLRSNLTQLSCLLVALSVCTTSICHSQDSGRASKLDKVWYGPVITSRSNSDDWEVPKTTLLTGRIRGFDETELVLVDQSGKSVRIASNRVFRVENAWTIAAATDALALLDERKYREAITALQAVLQEGLPPWQSQFLVRGLVRAASGLQRPRVAGIVFLQYLANANPPDLLYSDLPLAWTPVEPDQLLREQASKWIRGDSEIEQLLGASWSLSGSDRPLAQRTLTRLQTSESEIIAKLASCQLWRFVPPPQTMSGLQSWLAFRNKLIPPLQLGPTEFIADRLMRVGQKDLAVGQWMRIATVHPHRYDRAVVALEAAKDNLKQGGFDSEAERLGEWIKSLGN